MSRAVSHGVADGARTGGIRTRIAASCVRTVRPSSGIGTWYGDAELCGSLLSYGVRRRAANVAQSAHLNLPSIIQKLGELLDDSDGWVAEQAALALLSFEELPTELRLKAEEVLGSLS